jgi:uncharacterized membrane protein
MDVADAPATGARVLGAAAESAPLLGLPLWLWIVGTHDLWDDIDHGEVALLIFAPGLFMLATGLIAALLARFASRRVFVRDLGARSLRFQGVAVASSVVLCGALGVAIVAESARATSAWSVFHQPVALEGALAIFVVAFGGILTVLETGRAIAGVVRALRAG